MAKKHERKTTRKTVTKKKVSLLSKQHSSGRRNRTKETGRRISEHGKQRGIPKADRGKNKIRLSTRHTQAGGKATQGKVKRSGRVDVKQAKKKPVFEVRFPGSKTIKDKSDLFNTSSKVSKAIDKQLKRRKGKPPRGVIVWVVDKDGNRAGFISDPRLHVDKKGVLKTAKKVLTKDYWKDFHKKKQASGDTEFKPQNIKSVNVEFVY